MKNIVKIGSLWLIVLGYMTLTPVRYESEFSILLTGNRSNTSINLGGDGGTIVPGTNLTYSNSLLDPRAFYREILISDSLFKQEDRKKYKGLKVKILDPTPVIKVAIKGESAEVARQKAATIYSTFNQKIEQLREQERIAKTKDTKDELEKAYANLQNKQDRLVKFKVETGLNSEQQLAELLTSNETLKGKVEELKGLMEAKAGQLSSLEKQLRGSDILVNYSIQNDPLIINLIKDYMTAKSDITLKEANFTSNHPEVITSMDRAKDLENQILTRSRQLGVSKDLGDILKIVSQSNLSPIYQNYLVATNDYQGLVKQYKEAYSYYKQEKSKETFFISKEKDLLSLTKDYTTASIEHTNLLSQLQLSKVDKFGTYPLYQLISGPSLPKEAASPKLVYGVGGGIVGTLLIMIEGYIRRRRHEV